MSIEYLDPQGSSAIITQSLSDLCAVSAGYVYNHERLHPAP